MLITLDKCTGEIAKKHKMLWNYRDKLLTCAKNFTNSCKEEFGDGNTIILTLSLTEEKIAPLQIQFMEQVHFCQN